MSLSNTFTLACKAKGVYHHRCGMAVRDLLIELKAKPLRCEPAANGPVKMPRHASLGVAVKAGLARFISDQQCYVITPAGEIWLTELEIHGLINLGRAEA